MVGGAVAGIEIAWRQFGGVISDQQTGETNWIQIVDLFENPTKGPVRLDIQ